MKILTKILIGLFTFAVLAVGFFMPRAFSTYQDYRITSQTALFQTNAVEIQVNTGPVSDAMFAWAHAQEHIPLEDGKFNLTQEEVYEAASTIVDELGYASHIGFDQDSFSTYTLKPYLMASPQVENAAIVWDCTFEDSLDGVVVNISLDDNTGELISSAISYTLQNDIEDEQAYFKEQAALFEEMFRTYYNASGENLRDYSDTMISAGNLFNHEILIPYDDDMAIEVIVAAWYSDSSYSSEITFSVSSLPTIY